jgi:hypothetical protein
MPDYSVLGRTFVTRRSFGVHSVSKLVLNVLQVYFSNAREIWMCHAIG